MLAIDFEIEKEGMTVPYPPLSNDIRRNHGFVDLRGRATGIGGLGLLGWRRKRKGG